MLETMSYVFPQNMSLIRLKINIFCKVTAQKRSKIMIFCDFDEFGLLDLPTVKTKSRPPKLKICM